jgi:hypothetical protein
MKNVRLAWYRLLIVLPLSLLPFVACGPGAVDRGSMVLDAAPGTNPPPAQDAALPSPDLPPPAPDVPPPADVPVCTPACTVGSNRCGSGGWLQTCVVDPSNCPVWGTEQSCGSHASCAASGASFACVCTPIPAGCTGKGTVCAGNEIHACDKDDIGCLFLASSSACGARQTCAGSFPAAACTCSAGAGPCTAAGSYCVDPGHVGTCGKDADGCFFVDATKAPTSCNGVQACSGPAGSAACGCPINGDVFESGCADKNLGDTLCDGDRVLKCATTNGCQVWQQKTDCASSATGGLSCGTRGNGKPACECAEVKDDMFFVDPQKGSDATNAGKFPTGVSSPDGCQLRTITRATQIANRSGDVITVLASGRVTLRDETFPIVVSNGVSLRSDRRTQPENFIIELDKNDGAAFTLGDGSSLEGFTLANAANGASNAVAIQCTSNRGRIEVSNVVLAGLNGNRESMKTGLQLGLGKADNCVGTFDQVTLDGFRTGIAVNTGATDNVVLTDVTAITEAAADVAMQISIGSVTSTALTIKAQSNGAGTGIAVKSTASNSPARWKGVDTTIQGMLGAAIVMQRGNSAPEVTMSGNSLIADTTDVNGSAILQDDGTLTLTGVTLQNNKGDGVTIDSSRSNGQPKATISRGSKITGSGKNGLVIGATKKVLVADDVVIDGSVAGAGILFQGPVAELNVGSAGTGAVVLRKNGTHGLHVQGAGGKGAIVLVTNTTLQDNTLDGLLVDVATAGALIKLSGNDRDQVKVLGNAKGAGAAPRGGVVVLSAPSANANVKTLTLDGLEVSGSGKALSEAFGIALSATNGDVAAEVLGATIQDNTDTGLLVAQAANRSTVTILDRNVVTRNQVKTDATLVAGVLFATGSTLQSFKANRISDNAGTQVGFHAPQDGNKDWDLDAGNNCNDINNNRIFGYVAPNVGLLLDAVTPTKVDAQNIHWQNNPPLTAGVDFKEATGDTVILTKTCNKN